MLAHMMLANVAGSELLCTEAEALRIATAWVSFRRHYGGIGLDPKHQAVFALVVAIGTVEVPKLRDRMARQRAERNQETVNRAAAEQAGGGTVVPLNPAPLNPGGNGRPHPSMGWPAPH